MGNIDLSKRFMRIKFGHSTDAFKYGFCEMQGSKDYMQAVTLRINHFQDKNNFLFGIFDGHGGPEIAEFVKKHLPIQLAINQNFKQKKYAPAFEEALLKMDDLIQSEQGVSQIMKIISFHKKISNRFNFRYNQFAGCTANICLVTVNQIYVANTGDSRCLVCMRDNSIVLSFDHKPSVEREQKRIANARGYVRNGKINQSIGVSRSIGDLTFKKNASLRADQQMVIATPDVIKIKREEVRFIFMGSKGVWERKSNDQMMKWVSKRLRKSMTPTQILQDLFLQQISQRQISEYSKENMLACLIVLDG